MRPNLFIVGACKCGTSFLHQYLGSQKDICASSPKEPYYFELPEDKRNEKAYFKKYFSGYDSEKYLLDGRHRNMFFSWIPKAIYDFNTDAKIIFILRDPIERAYSHWWMWYSRKIIKTNFHKTVRNEIKRISEMGLQMDFSPEEYALFVKNNAKGSRIAYADVFTIVETGYYYTQVSRYKKIFNENQLLVLDYCDISNPDILLKKLEDFLEVKLFMPEPKNTVNKAPDFAKTNYGIGKYMPKTMKMFLKNRFLRKRKISEKTRILLKEHYEEENRKLVENLGIEFPKNWL